MNDTPGGITYVEKDAPKPTPSPMPNVEQQIVGLINNALLICMNGILYTLRMVPTDRVMVIACQMFGRLVGEVVSTGNLPAVLNLRRECREAFEKALREVKVQPAPEDAAKRPPQH